MRRLILARLLSAAHAETCRGASADCAAASTQSRLDACSYEAYVASDSRLNVLFREMERKLGAEPQTKALFERAEKRWLAFRDAECAFSSGTTVGGSIHPMITALCLKQATDRRIADLERYLHCPEGDLSCPTHPSR